MKLETIISAGTVLVAVAVAWGTASSQIASNRDDIERLREWTTKVVLQQERNTIEIEHLRDD